ncbi:hypothetical protein Q7P36_006914 [Cladosporium allicinum]
MSDPFEVRIKFTNLLHHLNASTNSALKCAHYALRYAVHAEDLHSCILEQLEQNNLNSRANIMYFLPALCEAASAAQAPIYIRMVERDVLKIVDLVAPPLGGGAANVRVVKSVLKNLEGKGETAGAPESPMSGTGIATDGTTSVARNTPASARDAWAAPGPPRLDKRQIEQRIEEDRERHKRAREGLWTIKQTSNNLGDDVERGKLWEETSDMEDDDYEMVKEEADQRKECLSFETLSLDTTTSSNATITTAVLEPDGLRRASQRQSKWDVQPFACASASGGESAEATAAELMWPPSRHDDSSGVF